MAVRNIKVVIFDNCNSDPSTAACVGREGDSTTEKVRLSTSEGTGEVPRARREDRLRQRVLVWSDVHMMSVQKLWEVIPEGFVLMDSTFSSRPHSTGCLWKTSAACGYMASAPVLKRLIAWLPMLLDKRTDVRCRWCAIL